MLAGGEHGHPAGICAVHRIRIGGPVDRSDRRPGRGRGRVRGPAAARCPGSRTSTKVLEIGTLVLFGCLALYAVAARPSWSVIQVRLCVDAGLLLIVLVSMLVGRPFTLQYARDQVAPEFWGSPEFARINYVITAVWALAFAVMVVAELALLYEPDLPPRVGIIAIVLALVGAIKFTGWYPERARKRIE